MAPITIMLFSAASDIHANSLLRQALYSLLSSELSRLAPIASISSMNRTPPPFLMSSSNIAEQLDPALIREGRIDQIINVPLPNYDSRVELFKLYIGKLKHEDDMDYAELAEKTEGKSGAFIASVCNHSGMYAVDQGCKKVKYEHVLHSMEKMLRDNKEKDNKKPIGFLLK